MSDLALSILGSEPPPAPEEREPRTAEPSHASDEIFRELASAILNHELKPDVPLPPERELAERFGVSRIVVREAIHRLKEYELVRVRQGSPTVVLDPDRATDIRLLGLEMNLVPPPTRGIDAFAERQIYSAAGLLDLAEQRMTDEELDALGRLLDALPTGDDDRAWLAFEREYWLAVARGTRNRVYVRETIFYFNLLERDPRFRSVLTWPPETRATFYRSFVAIQRNRGGAAAAYLLALRAARGMLV